MSSIFSVSENRTGVATQPYPGLTLNVAAATPVVLGGPFPYTGVVDEPSVYSRPLTPEEITTIYEAGVDGKCPV